MNISSFKFYLAILQYTKNTKGSQMTRKEAIFIGLQMMRDRHGIDASDGIPEFVHMMFNASDGTTRDVDIYPGLRDRLREEAESIEHGDTTKEEIMLDKARNIRAHLGRAEGEIDNLIRRMNPDDSYSMEYRQDKKESGIDLDEVEIRTRTRGPGMEKIPEEELIPLLDDEDTGGNIDIIDEWLEGSEEEGFSKIILARDNGGNRAKMRLELVPADTLSGFNVVYVTIEEDA